MIPIQLWSSPLWAQVVADTLPEMTFASAWTLLVTFFVQLVGVATGTTGTTTNPGMTIPLTAYIVYWMLVATYFWNSIATVLLYAVLCCIYAALFGTALYFFPRLLLLLYPSLIRHSKLALRLSTSTLICLFVFAGRTFGFARKVVAPPEHVSWWWQYGCLELLPSLLLLIMLHPAGNHTMTNTNTNTNATTPSTSGPMATTSRSSSNNLPQLPKGPKQQQQQQQQHQHQRQDSHGSASKLQQQREALPFLKPVSGYGSTGMGGDSGSGTV